MNKVGGKIEVQDVVVRHGLSKHPLYRVWTKIKERLYNKNHEAYHLYGGNGVIMCDEWKHNAPKFIEWAISNGWKKGLQIDKDIIPKKLGITAKIYSPEMCSIVTPSENCRCTVSNVFIEYNGKTQTLQDWCIELSIDQATLHHRLFDSNYSINDAFNLPIGYKSNILFEHNGKKKTINQWCKEYGIIRSTLVNRIKKGMTITEAITKPIAHKKIK